MHRQSIRNAAAVSSRVSSLPSPSVGIVQACLCCWTYLLNEGYGMGQDSRCTGGSNSAQFEFIQPHVWSGVRTVQTLNALSWVYKGTVKVNHYHRVCIKHPWFWAIRM